MANRICSCDRSASTADCMSAYCSLAASGEPSLACARWTWPSEAAAAGSCSKVAKRDAQSGPSSAIIRRLTKAQPIAMGWAFVKRRMMAELGPDWASRFATFEHEPAAAASLGQVHRAQAKDGSPLAAKLQYADMQSAVEADLSQLQILFAIHRRMDPAIDTREIYEEISARVREELDYRREAKHIRLYQDAFATLGIRSVRAPGVW